MAQHFAAEMRPMALLLNVVAASYATWRLIRTPLSTRKTLFYVTLPSLVAAFVGGLLVLGGKVYFALTGLLLVTAAVLMIVRREVNWIEAQSVKAFPAALAGAASGLLSRTDRCWWRRVPDDANHCPRLGVTETCGCTFAAIHLVQLSGWLGRCSHRWPKANF